MTGTVDDGTSRPANGVLTSPNFPEEYPDTHDSDHIIQVSEGKTLRLHFTSFNTDSGRDYVSIVDDDGDEWGVPKLWGNSVPEDIVIQDPNENVHVKFHTDGDRQRSGWRLEWTEL